VSFRALDHPQTVDVDPDAVREALANLLDNARRHATNRVEVTLSTIGDIVEMSVTDDGPGLPEDAVEQAFERFVVLDTQGGSGLGLSIARGIARAHDGDVTYEQGRFVIRFPSAPPPVSSASSA
jgi:signal transduction histidine kinase